MKTVHKYVLHPTIKHVAMPTGARILCVREQGQDICIWVHIDLAETRKEVRTFAVYGTGHVIPDDVNLTYVGTAILQGGSRVLHVFEQDQPA